MISWILNQKKDTHTHNANPRGVARSQSVRWATCSEKTGRGTQLCGSLPAPNEDITGGWEVGMLPGRTATASWGRAKGGTWWDRKLKFGETWHRNGVGAGLQIVKKEGTRLLYSFLFHLFRS